MLGHIIMGMTLSIMSIMGMLALAGVVVNDSLGLGDFMNHLHHAGALIKDMLVLFDTPVDHLCQVVTGAEMLAGRSNDQHFYRFIQRNFLQDMNNFTDHSL